MEEIWKEVPGYEGLYEVSSQGRVRSLDRVTCNRRGSFIRKGKILKPRLNHGYKVVDLHSNKKRRTFRVHQLVAMAFLGHKPDGTQEVVVDHINNNKQDNRLENLQLISQRENASKDKKGCSSKYTGVSWDKQANKWKSYIKIKGKQKNLGYFKCETAAFLAYQAELSKISVEN